MGTDDVGFLVVGIAMFKDVLWHLGRLAAPSVSGDDDDSIPLEFLQNLISMLDDRELMDQKSNEIRE